MSKKNIKKVEEKVIEVEHAMTRVEQFLETYQKQIVWAIGVVLGVALLYMAFQRYYVDRRSAEAAEQMFPAERFFENEDWSLALDGDGNNLGFVDIIDEYTFTPSAGLANYYAGVCYLHLSQYEDAISYLSKFKSKDIILSNQALGGIGDAYAELGDTEKAISFYKKAANNIKNDFTTPLYLLRAGLLLEQQGKNKEAGALYQIIKNEYATSTEGRNIIKYITRVELNQK
jgi:tetratricopeptide (TPR) repeat protein